MEKQEQPQDPQARRSAGVDEGRESQKPLSTEQRAAFRRTDEDLDQEWRRAGGEAPGEDQEAGA